MKSTNQICKSLAPTVNRVNFSLVTGVVLCKHKCGVIVLRNSVDQRTRLSQYIRREYRSLPTSDEWPLRTLRRDAWRWRHLPAADELPDVHLPLPSPSRSKWRSVDKKFTSFLLNTDTSCQKIKVYSWFVKRS